MMENKPNSIDDEIVLAHATIMQMSHAIMQMGSTDNSEKEKMQDIMNRLLAKTITPKEALTEAQSVIESKQDYH